MPDLLTKNFSRRELACPCCGACDMDPAFLAILQFVRDTYARPMIVTSGYRCPAHNLAVGGYPGSAHLIGAAVDIAVTGEGAYHLLRVAIGCGMRGIGVAQRGGERFLHLDNMMTGPRPRVWSY